MPESYFSLNFWVCLKKAVAHLLMLPASEIPDFFETKQPDTAHREYFAFLAQRGFHVVGLGPEVEPELKCAYLAIGDSPRGKWGHCVVRRPGRTEFDPHPSGAGLATVETIHLLCPFDPCASTRNSTSETSKSFETAGAPNG